MSNTNAPSTDDRYVTDVEAAELLGLSKSYLKQLRGIGGGPRYAKIADKVVRYRVQDLHAWAAKKTVGSTSEREAA